MGSTLPQCSHIGLRPGRVEVAHLTRRRGIYCWRRRLPARLGGEVSLSLGTRGFRMAEYLAAMLDGEFVRVVATVTPPPPQLRSILRAYYDERLAADTQQRLAATPGKPVYGGRVTEEADEVDADLEGVADALGDAREAPICRANGSSSCTSCARCPTSSSTGSTYDSQGHLRRDPVALRGSLRPDRRSAPGWCEGWNWRSRCRCSSPPHQLVSRHRCPHL